MGSESDKVGERGGGREAVQGMPAATKKVVQSLKEIVNCTDCTDQEIYAVLEECDMDPDRAVERLLAQDTFREVKSKRERKKEMKEAIDSRSRRSNVGSGRGGKTGSERNVVQSGSTHVTYNELGKAADKGDVGSVSPSVTSSVTRVVGKDKASDSFNTDNGRQSLGSAGVSPGLQPTLLGVSKVHLSMADIVRLGMPSQDAVSHLHSKASGVSASAKPESSLSLHYYNQSSQQVFNHEWPITEQPVAGNESLALKLSPLSNANVPSDHFNLCSTDSLLRTCVSDEVEVSQGDIARDTVNSDKIESGFLSSRHSTTINNAVLASHSNSYLKNTSATDSHGSSAHHEDVSSAASDFQRLSLRDCKMEVLSTEDSTALVLPNHVQGLSATCSHLSFGRYNCGSNSTSSAMLASYVSRSGLEEKAAAVDGGSLAHDASNFVYCADKSLGHAVFKEAAIDKNYDFLSSCQQELVKCTFPEATLGHEYTTMSSVADPSLQKSQWVSPSLSFKRPDLQNGNMSTFSREMVMEPQFSLPHRSALLQDLTVQSSLYMDQLADKRGYDPLTQNQQYLAAIKAQQIFSGSSAYNHSLAGTNSHLQNRNELFMGRLPPARGRDAFGYGNPGSYNPGSFLPNSSLGPMMRPSNFDEILGSQYNGGRSLSLIQQRGGFPTWDNGNELRSLSLPESMRYSSLGQPSQALPQYITPGLSELRHSETGIAAELQRQVGSQDLSSKQSHQFGSTATNNLLSAHILSPFSQ